MTFHYQYHFCGPKNPSKKSDFTCSDNLNLFIFCAK